MRAQRALVAVVLLSLPWSVHAQLIGHWIGTAKVADVWAYGKTFPVVLEVHRDGTASGTLGNAKLVGAHWKRKSLSPYHPGLTTWLVTGALTGSLMPKDRINATYAYIPIQRYHGKFSGGVNTHGTTHHAFFGTWDEGIMSCDLAMQRRP